MEEYWEWFCSIPGLYRAQQEILLHCFHDPKQLYEASAKELSFLQDRGCGWVRKVLAYRESSGVKEAMETDRKAGIRFVSEKSGAYPSRLRALRDRPYGLFFKGELPAEQVRAVGIVGARKCTPHGRGVAQTLAAAVVAAGGCVISGAAYGIDAAAQWAALEAGGKSYAVLGSGADVVYPSSSQRLFARLPASGGLLTEFPTRTAALPSHFPMRNRIISGLCDALIVVEAKKKSGSLITAEFALDQGRDVYAVPGRPDDPLSFGCNELIAQGAGLICSADALIRELFPETGKKGAHAPENFILAPAEKLVYSMFGLRGISLWELLEHSSLTLADMSDCLLSLERKGLIRETDQYFYIKIK